MRLEKIKYTNFRGLKTGELSFEKDLTAVIGKNGAGKTSVLSAVAIALSWIIARFKSEKLNGQYIDIDSITNPHWHSMIEYKFDEFEDTITIPNKSKQGISKRFSLNIETLKNYTSNKKNEFEESGFKNSVPTFVYYGVKRAVVDIPLRIRNKEYTLLDTYKDCLNGAANFRDFFTWFRNQEDIENELKLNGCQQPNKCTRELDTFRKALSVFMPEYKGIRVQRSPLRMQLWKNNEIVYANQLSDGEKTFLALIGDLCHRLVLANPTLPDPLQGEGIVLIDEIDLHLHPEWQGDFAENLSKVFPNIQFIITTHSPHVISRIDPNKIRILSHDCILNTNYSYGMPLNVILKDVMGLSSQQPEEIRKIFEEIQEALSTMNIPAAEASINKLQKVVPEHPELVRLTKIIERYKRR